MTPLEKLNLFMVDPSAKNLLSLDEFNQLDPFHMGFCHYIQSSWDESQLDSKNGLETIQGLNDDQLEKFHQGGHAGMIWAQDTEE